MVGGVITTGNSPKALWPGVFAWFGRGYDETKQEWMNLFEKQTSGQQYEELVSITGFGPADTKPEGQGVLYDSEIQGFVTRAVHVAYGLGYQVTKEELDDNLYEKLATSRAQSLGFSFRQTKENVGANFYNRATNSAYPLGDGVSLLNAAHPNASGGTFSNILAVGADLSEASIEDLAIQIMYAQDDRGLRINLQPKSLIIAPNEYFNAMRILKSTYQSGTANNDINVLNNMGVFSDGIKVNRYLSAPHTWFIRTNIPSKQGLIYFERVPIQFTQDNDFDTENMKAKGYERYSFTCGDPRALFGSVGP